MRSPKYGVADRPNPETRDEIEILKSGGVSRAFQLIEVPVADPVHGTLRAAPHLHQSGRQRPRRCRSGGGNYSVVWADAKGQITVSTEVFGVECYQ